MNGFIYIIRNIINSKVYIGQTKTSIEQRWKEHLRHAAYGNQVINRAMRKYGIDKFYIETLEICTIEILDQREIYYIDLYDSTDKSKGYNVSIGGNTPRFRRRSLSISQLTDLYVNKQWTLQRIADKFQVTRYIVSQELRKAGVTIRDNHSNDFSKFNRIPKEMLLVGLSNSKSIRAAAKYLNIPYSTFRKACIYQNIILPRVPNTSNSENVC